MKQVKGKVLHHVGMRFLGHYWIPVMLLPGLLAIILTWCFKSTIPDAVLALLFFIAIPAGIFSSYFTGFYYLKFIGRKYGASSLKAVIKAYEKVDSEKGGYYPCIKEIVKAQSKN